MLIIRLGYPRAQTCLHNFTPYLVQEIFFTMPFHYILACFLVTFIYEIDMDMAKTPYHSVCSERMLPYLKLLGKHFKKHSNGFLRTYVFMKIYFSCASNLPVRKKGMILSLYFRRNFCLVGLYLVFDIFKIFR